MHCIDISIKLPRKPAEHAPRRKSYIKSYANSAAKTIKETCDKFNLKLSRGYALFQKSALRRIGI